MPSFWKRGKVIGPMNKLSALRHNLSSIGGHQRVIHISVNSEMTFAWRFQQRISWSTSLCKSWEAYLHGWLVPTKSRLQRHKVRGEAIHRIYSGTQEESQKGGKTDGNGTAPKHANRDETIV